jgi:hypothetical protein
MAFVRRVRTPSGATGVQVVEYVSPGCQRLVKYVGSARTPAELGVLMCVAREFLQAYDQPGQGVLDLGIEPVQVVGLVAEPERGVLLDATSHVLAPTSGSAGRIVGTASHPAVRRDRAGLRRSGLRRPGRRGVPGPGGRPCRGADEPAGRRAGPGRSGTVAHPLHLAAAHPGPGAVRRVPRPARVVVLRPCRDPR